MKASRINQDYIDLILNNKEDYHEDYKKTMEKIETSEAQYKGKPIPTIYHPMFYSEDDLENFKKIGNMMIRITNKVTDRYIEDKDFRKKFGFPKFIEELIEVDNGYDIHVPIGRFDIFYKDYDNFKFCELNTDGSSAMNEENTISDILLESKGLQDFSDKYDLSNFELFDSWIKESIKIYKKFDPSKDKPNVAIVDFVESGTTNEFKKFKVRYEALGYNCIIVDPRELDYRDGALYHKDYKIDLVYRRIVTFEIIDKIDEIPDFIEAYKARAFCCIGSIRSQVIHNKIFFKILHDHDTLEGLDEEEVKFVKDHIPHTGIFGGDREVFDLIAKNKDKYIMKPMDLNASQGVYPGRDFSQEGWEKRLEEDWEKDYLFQEYCDPYTRDFLVYGDGNFHVENHKSIIGLYIYNEKFAGIYTRIGQESIIAGTVKYYTLGSILAKEKI